ncbi:MAG: hypothetical protein WA139_01515 [Candidatus Aenigmatarchaeota archaeon]
MNKKLLLCGITAAIILISIGVLYSRSAERIQKQPYSVSSDTSPFVSVNAAISNKYLSLNEEANITIATIFALQAPNTTINIVLPEGLEYVSGDLNWNGDLNISGGNVKKLEFTAKATKIGKWQVNASAHSSRKDEIVSNGMSGYVALDICVGAAFEEAKELCKEEIPEPDGEEFIRIYPNFTNASVPVSQDSNISIPSNVSILT